MIGIVGALAYGLAAGLFAPLAVFATGLLLGLAALAAARYGAVSLGAFGLEAVILLVASQIGYATSIFLRATLLKSKRDAAALPDQPEAASGEKLRGLSD